MRKETFIEKVNTIHRGMGYDFSKVDYKGYNQEVVVICPKHGEFNILPSQLLKGYGCPQCVTDKEAEAINHTFTFNDDDEWVTREECIKKIGGVSRTTFDMWLREKLFTYKVYKKILRISKSSFERFINEDWDTYKENLIAKKSLHVQKDSFNKQLGSLSIKTTLSQWFTQNHCEEFLMTLFKAAEKTLHKRLKKRDLIITTKLLNGQDISSIAREYSMTEANVRLIFTGVIKAFNDDNCKGYDELVAELYKKDTQLAKQRMHIAILTNENNKLAKEAQKKRTVSSLRKYLEIGDNVMSNKYFSTGTLNALRTNGINSIVDLTEYTPTQLIRLPRIGRKACEEIENALKKNGLSLKNSGQE